MLSPLCGAPPPLEDRWSQPGHWTTAGALRRAGLAHLLPRAAALPDGARLFDAGAIAPWHRACAERALGHCPHQAAAADKRLKRFPDRWLAAPLTVPAAPPPPSSTRASRGLGAAAAAAAASAHRLRQ